MNGLEAFYLEWLDRHPEWSDDISVVDIRDQMSVGLAVLAKVVKHEPRLFIKQWRERHPEWYAKHDVTDGFDDRFEEAVFTFRRICGL